MLVRRLPSIALLAGSFILLANCSSDNSGGTGGGAGAPPASAGASGSPASAGAPAAGASASGAPSGGGGSTSVGGAGSSSVAGGGSGGTSAAGTSAGGTSAGGTSAGGTSAGGSSAGAAGKAGAGSGGGATGSFTLSSPDQAEGAHFSKDFTCDAMNGTFGAGVNPELDWSGVPAGTMSFALTFIDTKIGADMAMGQHWAAWDIPASAMKFPKGTTTLTGALAGAKQTNKYLAPCPSGDDTYEFALYALSSATLSVTGAEGTGVSNSAGVAKVLAALKAVTPLGKATLHGTSSAKGK